MSGIAYMEYVYFTNFFSTAYAGSKAPQSLHSLVRAMVGKTSPGEDAYMSPRERLDFAIILPLFAVIGAA
jgi:FLVCR family MFS transporter 7